MAPGPRGVRCRPPARGSDLAPLLPDRGGAAGPGRQRDAQAVVGGQSGRDIKSTRCPRFPRGCGLQARSAPRPPRGAAGVKGASRTRPAPPRGTEARPHAGGGHAGSCSHAAIPAGPTGAPRGRRWGPTGGRKGLGSVQRGECSSARPPAGPGARPRPGPPPPRSPASRAPAWMMKLIGPCARRAQASTSGPGPGGGSCGAPGRPRPAPRSSGSRWARGAAGAAGTSGRTRRRSARSGPSWWPRPPRR